MRRFLLALLPLLVAPAVPAQAQGELQSYKCRPLGFEIGVPAGWKAQQDLTGMVASTRDVGFMVSREPFLGVEKEFAKSWGDQLAAAGVKARVKATRSGKYTAYQATWTAEKAGRTIEVWRILVPVNEMLYNVSFSAKQGDALKTLVRDVLRSLKITAKAEQLKFQREELSLGPRVGIKPPVDYVKAPRGVSLGGGLSIGLTKMLPGYSKPHTAGVIAIRPARGQTKKLVQGPWDKDSSGFEKVLKKPRTKSAKYGGIKGHALRAYVVDKRGNPKLYAVFAGKLKQTVILITVMVDAREDRMYGDYLKQVCSQIHVAD